MYYKLSVLNKKLAMLEVVLIHFVLFCLKKLSDLNLSALPIEIHKLNR